MKPDLFITATVLLLGVPALSQAQDTLFLPDGKRVIAYVEKASRSRTTYRLSPDTSSERYSIRPPRFIHFADGSTWPRTVSNFQQRKFGQAEAELEGRRHTYNERFRARRHRILVMGPGYHQIRYYGGVSVGLMYDRSVDSNGRFSVGAALQHIWAGTMQSGEMSEGERRDNIHLSTIAPTARYHPLGNRRLLDPAIGIAVPAGRYRLREEQYRYNTGTTATSTAAFFISPQAELSLSLNTNGAFSFQVAVAAGPESIGGAFDNGFYTFGQLRMGWRF